MAVPDYQTLMLPVLKAVASNREVHISDCIDWVANELALSDADLQELLPSGKQTTFRNRVQWARTYLTRAGLIESSKRGHSHVTDRGKSLLLSKPDKIDNNYLMRYPEFVSWREKSNSASNENIDVAEQAQIANPEEMIESTHAVLQAELAEEILDTVINSTPSFFEKLIVDLLIAMGYGGGRAEMGRSLGKSGDNGIDGVIKEDQLGLDLIYLQAKKYDRGNSIGRPALQAFVGSLEGFNATKGVFVTTSSFASSATEYATKVHKRIILIDGETLASLMVKYNVGVRIKNVYEVKKIDEDYFIE